jgi:hypothetical protein
VTLSAVLVEPAHHTCPSYRATLGPEVGALCELIGFGPDPEQQLILDDVFALDSAGRSAVFEGAVIAPRQNLKTGVLKQCAIGWMFISDQRLIVWSAHEFRTAQEAFRDMEQLIMGSPMLARRVKNVYRGSGAEAIELLTGQRLIFKARTKGGGRGLTGSKVILDEAFALQPAHMGALLPTLSAVPDPQVLYASSAGDAGADVLRSIRDRGRAGDPRMSYLEWCFPQGMCASATCDHALTADGCSLDDPENWHQSNSALGRRMTVEHIAAERRAMPPDEFGRERAGWWDEPSGVLVIPSALWAECLDLGSKVTTAPVFALDVSPDRSWSAIAVAGMTVDGLPHVEITSSGSVVDHLPGVGWVVPRCVTLAARWPGMRLTVIGGSAAESLVPDLVAAGVPVEFVKGNDVAAACGLFFDKATTAGLRHVGQVELTSSLAAARKNVEDGEVAWRWGRRRSSADITPLYAATLALWALIASSDMDPANNVW